MANPCVLLSPDLMLASQAIGAAQRAGCTLEIVATEAQLMLRLASTTDVWVAVDLTTPGMKIADLVNSLRNLAEPPASVLAFGPHVQSVRLDAARAAGCDQVLTRGQFHAQLESILREWNT